MQHVMAYVELQRENILSNQTTKKQSLSYRFLKKILLFMH